MKLKNYILLPLTLILLYTLTGCYTQVATSEPYSKTTVYKQTSESYDYYSEEGELLDSSYLEETDPDEESLVIVKEYYDYPYYDYYPSILIGIGFGFNWGWGGYYPYWSYYPYYSGWCGYGWYYPSYCYYPTYYYPGYYCDPFYGYGGYYPYYNYGYYGSYPRDEYVTRVRNNSGGRNYPGYRGNSRELVTTESINRVRDDVSNGRDLKIDRTRVTDRSVDIRNNTGEVTRQVVGLNDQERVNQNKRSDISSNELTRTNDVRKDNKQYGLDREVTSKKTLGIDNRNNVSKNTSSNTLRNYSDQINKNNRVGSESKKLFDKKNSNNIKKETNVRKNNTNTKRSNEKTNTNRYQTPKRNTDTRSYSPPKKNNNQPKTYSPPKSNNNKPKTYSPPNRTNNSPKSYSPPRTNSSPRSSTPPSRSSGSNNSGNRRR